MGSGGPDPRAVGGFLIVALKVGEYRFLVVEHSIEIYGAPARTFPVVMRNDVGERGRAAVVEVRRVPPECTQRRGAIGLLAVRAAYAPLTPVSVGGCWGWRTLSKV
jgi:hypothetical protein